MDWTNSETTALALHSCAHCHGRGLRGSLAAGIPCECVLRSIFQICYRRFVQCLTRDKLMCTSRMQQFSKRASRRTTWGRQDEEYVADFMLIVRRSVTPVEYDIFRYHLMLGADWKMCARKLNMDRGTFFHALYRMQEKLGRIFRELEPFALYPLDEYFNTTIRMPVKASSPVIELPRRESLRRQYYPLPKTA